MNQPQNESNLETETNDLEGNTEPLADLTVEDDTQVIGGRTDGAGQGGPVFNHNETISADDEAETEALDDLSVEDDEQVKGGPSGGITKLGSKLLTL